MDLKDISGVQRTKEFLGKSVKKQNPNIILDMFRENSNCKTFGVKDTSEISDKVIKKLLEEGYSWNTIDSCTDRGRAVDLNILNPITGKKHQLRLQMCSLGIPIINDRIYPQHLPESLTENEKIEEYKKPLKLLAKTLEFIDPITKHKHQFSSQFRLNFD